MKNEAEKIHRRAIWLARFWNYGYFIVCLLLLSIPVRLIDRHPWMPYIGITGFVGMFLSYGIILIVIAVQWRRSFVYSMQMKYISNVRMFWPPDKKMQLEGILIGGFFAILSLLLAGIFVYEHILASL